MNQQIAMGVGLPSPDRMTLPEIQLAVEQGKCTGEQVRQTLLNAHLSEEYIALFGEGRLPVPPYAAAMLRQLIERGKVPLGPVKQTE